MGRRAICSAGGRGMAFADHRVGVACNAGQGAPAPPAVHRLLRNKRGGGRRMSEWCRRILLSRLLQGGALTSVIRHSCTPGLSSIALRSKGLPSLCRVVRRGRPGLGVLGMARERGGRWGKGRRGSRHLDSLALRRSRGGRRGERCQISGSAGSRGVLLDQQQVGTRLH